MKFQICLLALLLLAGKILTEGNQSEPAVERTGIVGDQVSSFSSGAKVKLRGRDSRGSRRYSNRRFIPGTAPRRTRRMTCEALSYPLPFGYYNHGACASYCFLNGKNFWGHCQFGWCKCR